MHISYRSIRKKPLQPSTLQKKIFLNAAKEQIEAEYGSVQTYLKKGIGLSAEEIEQLRSILLTDN